MAEVQRGWAGAVWVLNAIWEQVFRDFVPGTGWSLRLGCAEGGSSPWWEVRAVPHPGRHTLALGCPAAEQQEKPSWQAQSQCQSKRKTNKQTKKSRQNLQKQQDPWSEILSMYVQSNYSPKEREGLPPILPLVSPRNPGLAPGAREHRDKAPPRAQNTTDLKPPKEMG